MNYISKCDWIVYDLHAGNPEDVKNLALRAFEKPRGEDEPQVEQTLVLISSLLAWDATPKNLEEIRDPEDIKAEMAAQNEAALSEEAKGDGEEAE